MEIILIDFIYINTNLYEYNIFWFKNSVFHNISYFFIIKLIIKNIFKTYSYNLDHIINFCMGKKLWKNEISLK